nr:P2X purinoceptor 7-like [Misgurnus anguillicaudatus]
MSSNSTSSSFLSGADSEISLVDPTVVRGRGRARGQRGRGSVGARRGAGRRGRGGERETQPRRGRRPSANVTRDDLERIEGYQRQRREATERLLQDMTLDDHRRLTAGMLERQPGLIFDLLFTHQQRHGAYTSAEVPGLPWCTCSHCRDMPTDRERKCCGQDPVHCVSLLPHFTQYCLDEGYLRIHRQYREDLTAFGNVREPGDDNREYRHAAYRHFIFWQHGALGQGNRRVIPSCCVSRIREKFPDPHGQYTGYIPGI